MWLYRYRVFETYQVPYSDPIVVIRVDALSSRLSLLECMHGMRFQQDATHIPGEVVSS